MKPRVLFFARNYHADFFVFLKSNAYESIFVTLTNGEKKRIEKSGYKVAACLEEEFDNLIVSQFPDNYLETSFSADRYLRHAPVFERREILGKEISFWARVLDEYTPSLVVNETVAIEISEVLHIEAARRGIRYVSWMNLSIPNHFYWQTSPLHNSLDPVVFHTSPSATSVEKAEKYMGKVQSGEGRPFYVNSLKSRYSLHLLSKNAYWVVRCLLTEHRYRKKSKNLVIYGDNVSFYRERIVSVLNSLFFRYDTIDKYKEFEFVFYPLHYEPEAALFYMAEFFDNQLSNLEQFAKCLGHNQVLVVKEHPQQPGVLLQRKFRKLKERISNLIFLPAEYSTYHLLKKSKLVLTLGSTAGIEALILGKPVVIMGKVFYDQYEKINPVTNFPDLRKFIQGENWKYPDADSLKRFLAQLIEYSKPGNPFPHQELYTESNIEKIVSAIETELEKKMANEPA